MSSAGFKPGRESGVSLIETIIAAFVMVVVMSTLVVAVSSSGRTHTAAKVTEKQSAVLEAVWERVSNDTTWRARCRARGLGSCPISLTGYDDILRDPLMPEVRFAASAVAVGRDAPADGVGANDRDRVRLDEFVLTVELWAVRPDRPSERDTSLVKPVSVSGTVQLSVATTGSLQVQVCQITPQVDERIRFARCDGGTRYQMRPPFARPGDPYASYAVAAWNAAYARDRARFTQVTVGPVSNARIRVTGPTGQVWSVSTNSRGIVSIPNVAEGRYRVAVQHPNGGRFVPWESHSLPSHDEVQVVRGEQATMLAAFRPTSSYYHLVYGWRRGSRAVKWESTAVGGYYVRLLPVPYGRQFWLPWSSFNDYRWRCEDNFSGWWRAKGSFQCSEAADNGWRFVTYDTDEGDAIRIEPGLYAMAAITQHEASGCGSRPGWFYCTNNAPAPRIQPLSHPSGVQFIWIDPAARAGVYSIPAGFPDPSESRHGYGGDTAWEPDGDNNDYGPRLTEHICGRSLCPNASSSIGLRRGGA